MHVSEGGGSQGAGGTNGGSSHSPTGNATQGTYLIAIVEDDAAVAQEYSESLESVPGWRTFRCANGDEALRVIPQERPDVILLDLGLPPGVQGSDLFLMLQGHRDTLHIPIAIITARQEWQVERSQLGSYWLLHKPHTLDELLATVTEMLAEARTRRGEP